MIVPLVTKAVPPENGTYSDAVRNGKKTFTVGTGTVKSINMKETNTQSDNSFAKRRSFPGATLKQLKNYVVPSLIDKTPDRIILHGGFTDVNKKNSTPEEIANEIGDVVILCCGFGFNDIFMSAMIY